MKNINFNVSQDTIEKLSEDVIISDSYNYVCLIFNFDSSWSQYNVKKATFFSDYEDGEEKYEADIINNVCVVPFEILKKSKFKDSFFIGVYGQVIEDEILKQRNTTNMISFKLRQGAYFANALSPGEIEPSAYDLYLAKLKEVFEKGLNDYNLNATQKTNEYNKNADKREEEINNKVSDIEKIEENIEQIQKNVQASEQNAKTSETNAKTSEINAQNSAKNASEIETNIISIQEDINKSKGEINTAKESVDKSLEKVYSAVTEATNQAKESKKQAGIATSKANQTSIDKSAVETMRNEVSSMKTSVEQTKTDTEKIKADTQAIKDDTEALKEETLQAKEEVENSLENERIISDKKYARAIDSDVISVDNFGQVDVEQDGYMKDVEIESALPEITQEKREGYNRLDISTLQELDQDGVKLTKENGVVTLNGRSTATFFIDAYIVGSSSAYEEFLPAGTYTVSGITGEVLSPNFGILIVIKHLDESKTTITQNGENKVFNVADSDIFRVFIRIPQNLQLNNIVIKPMIVLGTENKDFEQYGSSPSLNYPSEFKNILSSFNIKNTVDEIEKYNKQITLPENKFLGNFNGYKNIIQNGKLKCNLKIYKLDANMDFSVNGTGTTGVQFLTPIIEDLKSNLSAKNILSTISKNLVGSTASKKIRFIIPYKELGTTSENTKAEHIAALKNKLSNIRGEFLYPVDNEEETELEDINLPLYKGINNIFAEDLKVSFKYNVSIEKYIEDNNIIERKISDNKYARALKTQVTDVESTQIYAENDVVEELKIKGVELTQSTREGYNLLSTENLQELNENGITLTKENGIVTINGQSTATSFIDAYIVGSSSNYEEFLSAGTYLISGITGEALSPNFGILVVIKRLNGGITTILQNSENKVFNVNEGDTFRVFIRIPQNLQLSNVVIKPMIVAGTEEKPYEEYGASPSLDFPSEVQVASEQNITINETNITIPLTNSAIGQYADTIDRENNVQNKVIQEFIFDGTEDWQLGNTKEITQVFTLNINLNCEQTGMCNYLTYKLNVDEELFTYAGNVIYIAVNKTRASTLEEFKTLLAQLNSSGNPLKIYLARVSPTTNPLSEEVQTALSNFKLYQDLNNVAIDGGSVSFIYNKSLIYTINQLTQLVQTLSSEVQALQTPTTEPTVETTSEVQADG